MSVLLRGLLALALAQTGALPAPAVQIDPAIRSVIERFFETQQQEDARAYLSLWSVKAQRPQLQQLEFIFQSGDDTFSDLTITHADVREDSARVRVQVTRSRTDLRATRPDGQPRTFTTRLIQTLSLLREEGAWRIVREGPPADELATALIDEPDPDARRTLREAEPDLVNVRLIESLFRRADPLARNGQFKPAQQIYERALEIAEALQDRKSIGQAMQNIANSLYYQRDFAASRAMYEKRLALEREASDDEGAASALVGLANLHYSSHEYTAALLLYREAQALQERLDDVVLLSNTLISTGNVLYLQGDYEAAIVDYARAETLKRNAYDLAGAAMALDGLGRSYTGQGDYAGALKAFAEALDIRRRMRDTGREALTLQSIGEIHFRLANTDVARTTFDEARALFEKGKDPANVGRLLLLIAVNELVAGRPAAGEKAYARAIDVCTPRGDVECVARAQVGLGFALAAQEKYADAIPWYRRSIDGFTGLDAREAAARARVGLSEALIGTGEYAEALKESTSARYTAVALDSDDLLWRALVSHARGERKLQRGALALGTARAAVLAVRRMAAAALERPGRAAPKDSAAAYATMAILQSEVGEIAGAFTTIEEMRAHALRIALAPHERDISRGMTDDERAVERKLAVELMSLQVQREREKSLPKPDTERLARLDEAIASALSRRQQAQQPIFERLPELRAMRGLAPALTSDAAATAITDAGTLLVQFVVDDHEVLVVTASRDDPEAEPAFEAHVIGVERRTLAERVARALESSSLQSAAGWRKESAELFTTFPAELKDRLASARAIIAIPDDILWRVPFEAMPVGQGFLDDRVRVRYEPSLTLMVAAEAFRPKAEARGEERVTGREREAWLPPSGGRSTALIVCAPFVNSAAVDRLKAMAPSWVVRAAEAGDSERAAVAAAWQDPLVLSGEAATLGAFRDAVAAASSIHIGAPFRVNAASPLFSPILLSPGEGDDTTDPRIGVFEARETFALTSAAAVVLFSDPASLSMRESAAALSSIYWAWRSTGAGALMLRRWGGGQDQAATAFLRRFHEALGAGESPAEAWDRARRALRAQGHSAQSDEDRLAPAAWAGWLLIGR